MIEIIVAGALFRQCMFVFQLGKTFSGQGLGLGKADHELGEWYIGQHVINTRLMALPKTLEFDECIHLLSLTSNKKQHKY